MNPHKQFILTQVSEILKEAVSSVHHIGLGIETYPLSDYVMQSVFIKMTGAQEQKMKCIAWELASNDFEFRREFADNFSKTEFSNYDDKNKLYKKIIEQIKLTKTNFEIKNNDINKNEIYKKSILENIIYQSTLTSWSNRLYGEYTQTWSTITNEIFAISKIENNKNVSFLLNDILLNIYKNHLYRNRNRIAHNTKSYQQNLPALERLKSDDYQYENYFLWFSILILIDEIFIELYKVYLETLEQKTFI